MEGKPEQASADLAQAQQDLAKVRPQEGKDELVGVKDFLVRQGGRDTVGHEGRPGVTAEGGQGASDSGGRGAVAAAHHGGHRHARTDHRRGGNNPPATSPRPTHSPRPTSRQHPPAYTTDAPVAPELTTGEAGAAPTAHRSRPRRRARRTPPPRRPVSGMGPHPHLVWRRRAERGFAAAVRRADAAAQESDEHRVRVAAAVLPRHVVGRVRIERGLVRTHLALVEQLLQARPQQAPLVVVLLAAIGAVDHDAPHAARLQQTPGTRRDRRDRPPPRRAPRCSTPRARRAPGRRSRTRGRADPRRTGPAAAHRVTQRQRYSAVGAHPRRWRVLASGADTMRWCSGASPRCWER